MSKTNKKELKNYNSNHYCLIKNFIKEKDLSQIDKTFRIYLKKFLNFEIKSKKFIFHNKSLHNFLIKKNRKINSFFTDYITQYKLLLVFIVSLIQEKCLI